LKHVFAFAADDFPPRSTVVAAIIRIDQDPAMVCCAASRRNSVRRDAPGRAAEGMAHFHPRMQDLVLLLGASRGEFGCIRKHLSHSRLQFRKPSRIRFLVSALERSKHAHDAAVAAKHRNWILHAGAGDEIEPSRPASFPRNDLPGAREPASCISSIGLATFSADDQKTYREGLPELQARVTEMFPNAAKFSSLTPQQQDEVLHSLDEMRHPLGGPSGRVPAHRISSRRCGSTPSAGFLIDPDYGGNDSGAGWKVIGR